MSKPPVKTKTVRFRALPKELAVWKRHASANARTLSNWIRERLNKNSGESSMQATSRGDDQT
jgi:hypothetical protein